MSEETAFLGIFSRTFRSPHTKTRTSKQYVKGTLRMHCRLLVTSLNYLVSWYFFLAHRKFPGLISGPTIDWFLPWPEEALVAVSHGLVAEFPMDCPADIKGCLMTHMGVVHRMVTEVKPFGRMSVFLF